MVEYTHEGMHRRGPTKADEYDAFTPWRQLFCYMQRPGVTRKIKRQFNRRKRRQARVELEQMRKDFD